MKGGNEEEQQNENENFQNLVNELGNSVHRTPVLELPSTTDKIKKLMDEDVYDELTKELLKMKK